MSKPLKHPLLFPDLPRRQRRKLMHVADAGEGPAGPVIRFACRCGFETDWLDDEWSLTQNRRGHPCPKCNPADPEAVQFADSARMGETMPPEKMLARLLENPVALSIRAPWTEFILRSGKDIENRSWATPHRGPVFIHKSKHIQRNDYNEDVRFARKSGLISLKKMDELWCYEDGVAERKVNAGHIIGMVEVVDCVTKSDSPWFFGPFGFVLANPVAFTATVPCKGRLGVFTPACDLSALRLPEAQP